MKNNLKKVFSVSLLSLGVLSSVPSAFCAPLKILKNYISKENILILIQTFILDFFDKETYFEVLKENGVFEESGWKRTITRANKNDIFAGYYVKYKNTMNNN